jgi:hypothetical protein
MYSSGLSTPASELELRIAKLQAHLIKKDIDAALILQRVDLFYFSGTIQQANLYIPAQGDPLLLAVKSSERAMAESAIERIVPLKSLKTIPKILKQNGYDIPKTLGLELDVLPANLYFNYQSIFKSPNIVDISYAIRIIRAVKSDYELDIMRQAGKLSELKPKPANGAIKAWFECGCLAVKCFMAISCPVLPVHCRAFCHLPRGVWDPVRRWPRAPALKPYSVTNP